jgi:AraC family ethanolamine operon transcriptional activator
MAPSGEQRIALRQFDLPALSGVLRVCPVDMVLLGSGKPRAVLGSVFHDGAVLCAAEYEFAFRGRFVLPPDWCILAYIHRTAPGSWCQGDDISAGTALTILPDSGSDFMLTEGSCWSGVVMPVSRLRRTFSELTAFAMDIPVHRLTRFHTGGYARGEQLQKRFERLRRHFIDGASDIDIGDIDGLVNDHLSAGIAADREVRSEASRARRSHYQVVRNAEEYMIANLRHDIDTQKLCNAAGTSERTLRNAFNDLFGVSPNRYLSMLRLCAASRNLRGADTRRRTVKSVALSCGLWDLSRFADNYRRLFGELPNQTLAQREAEKFPAESRRSGFG